jgi:hypothetical protein
MCNINSIRTDYITRHKCPYLRNTYNPKYQQKSKFISSPEQNCFLHFAMRYPVLQSNNILTFQARYSKLCLFFYFWKKLSLSLGSVWLSLVTFASEFSGYCPALIWQKKVCFKRNLPDHFGITKLIFSIIDRSLLRLPPLLNIL